MSTRTGSGRPATRGRNGSRNGRTSNAPRVPFALLVGGLLLGGLVLLLALNTASAANELHRSAAAVKDQEVSADVAQLRNEVAASAAPGNLAVAAQQLGMVPAAHPAFIIEGPNGSTVLRGHARPVTDDPLDIPSGTRHASPSPTTRVAASAPESGADPASESTSATSTGSASSTSSSSSSSSSTGAASNHPMQHRAAHRAHHTRHQAQATPTTSTSSSGGNR